MKTETQTEESELLLATLASSIVILGYTSTQVKLCKVCVLLAVI